MSNRIKELRTEKKITQLQLSIALGVTQETISAYEHDRHMPSLSALMKMSELFDASMDYIMGLSNVRHMPLDAEGDSGDSEQKNKLIYFYSRLGTKNKARLLAYAQGLWDSRKE